MIDTHSHLFAEEFADDLPQVISDLKTFTIPFFEDYAFTDMEEANAVAEALRNAKTLRKVEYDWNKLGSDYKSVSYTHLIPIVYRNTFNHVNMRTHDAILY